MINAQNILRRPIITERATTLGERFNQVAFEVDRRTNKHQIRDAVESVYGVRVRRVHTMVMPGKLKRRGTDVGKTPKWKKAIVTLQEGDVIDFFATE